MSLRIATFNVENLMERFDFSGWANDRRRDPAIGLKDVSSPADFRTLELARTVAYEDDARQMTALAIAACRADVICLQEVENLDALEAFERNYLSRMTGIDYPHKVWREGNDTRGIDVALMARATTSAGALIEVKRVKSHSELTFEEAGLHTAALNDAGVSLNERVFRRDCLEVDLKVGGKPLTLYLAHLKSMGGGRDGLSGRERTMTVRHAEAAAIRGIIEARFGERAAAMRWLVAGDLNDYDERLVLSGADDATTLVREEASGIDPLVRDGFCVDLVKRRAEHDRWTLYHVAGPVERVDQPWSRTVRHLVQLDYLLASPSLARANPDAVPDIIRNGQPYRTPFPAGQAVERYPRIGWERPKASDHCPVAVSLDMT